MKIKQDFVTNSSTCCFVVIGWELDNSRLKHLDEYQDGEDVVEHLFWRDALGVVILEGEEQGASSNDKTIIAVTTIDSEIEELHQVDFDGIVDHEKVIEIRQKLNLLPDEKLKIITGTKMC